MTRDAVDSATPAFSATFASVMRCVLLFSILRVVTAWNQFIEGDRGWVSIPKLASIELLQHPFRVIVLNMEVISELC